MILTGEEIKKEVKSDNINILPFKESMVNPNSYNYHLGNKIKIFKKIIKGKYKFVEIEIPKYGYILHPNTMYLGHTQEIIGSKKYAMSLIGRSSIGRLGLFVQVSADLGHTTSNHQWTLELVAVNKIKIYPGMKIGQVSFWANKGRIKKYDGLHGLHSGPQESLI